MNPHLERALLLYQQSRYEPAEQEIRAALGEQPQDAFAHALLGLCLMQREKLVEAATATAQAIHLGPDLAYAHYAHALVAMHRNRFDESLVAINEAIRLEPTEAHQYALLANLHLQSARWPEALAAAEQGLQFDPEDSTCTNLRAMAMVRLGRKEEAGQSIDASLAKNPQNSHTHANMGWTLLHQGNPKKAAEHFREALRLDPENEWARLGILEALKAKNILYALMLRYFLWMSKFSSRAQWFIILGAYFGNSLLRGLAQANPALAPWIMPLRALYIIFALLTWLAYPIFTLLLRLNKFGRMVLSEEETKASNWFGNCLMLALLCFCGCLIKGFNTPWVVATICPGLLLLPLSGVFRCPEGWLRRTMAGLTIAAALCGLAGVIQEFMTWDHPLPGNPWLTFFTILIAASTIAFNFLVTQRPKR